MKAYDRDTLAKIVEQCEVLGEAAYNLLLADEDLGQENDKDLIVEWDDLGVRMEEMCDWFNCLGNVRYAGANKVAEVAWRCRKE